MELSELKLTSRRHGLLVKMGITNVEQLLRTYPYRYETIEATPFSSWEEHQTICFEGRICSRAQVIRFGKNRSMTKFNVISNDEELHITLFNRPWASQFTLDKEITIFGQYNGNYEVTASNYNFQPLSQQEGIHPVYTLTQGMKQKEMQTIIEKALKYSYILTDYVPVRYQNKYQLMSLQTAIEHIHRPKDQNDIKQAARTLKYSEFLSFQCVMQSMHQVNVIQPKAPKDFDQDDIEDWIQKIPYPLTPDQRKSIDDCLADLRSEHIMFRLVQGDVGCGKTTVALTALYACYLSGFQSTFLAPTEILARQHYEKMQEMGLPVHLYISALPAKEKKAILEGMADGSVKMVVGTHALFQESVIFKKLGLVVADEQQRFGVRQRRALLEKGEMVDFLMMSATPIPRTYAHFIYGNMDISNIHTMPPGRKPVITKYISGISMKPILNDILKGIEEGRQCYVVCPSIEESEDVSLRSATAIYNGMVKTLVHQRIGLLHGKMTSEQKNEVMERFINKDIDILVSTTVIEVGIDVKNATLMVIYDAHRFGLSTLHQLRGRVARGSKQGYCYLLSNSKEEQAIQRLKKLETVTDGFAVSDLDLSMRGPGDILGVRQSGLPGFIFGDLDKDKAMMDACVQDAKEILEMQADYPMLEYVQSALEKAEYLD